MGFEIENGVLKKYKEEAGITEVVIPEGVTKIDGNFWEGAFRNCRILQSVTIPEGVTSIGGSAFSGCINLQNINIPDSVKSIGNAAFRSCRSLRSINIPNGVTSIGDYVFWGCSSLKALKIFGYTVDGTKCNWKEVEPSDILSMLRAKDYSVKIDDSTKYQFVAQVFLKTGQPEAEAYIKKNIAKILPYFIAANDYHTLKGLLDSDKFVTKHNIMKFIDYAMADTQKDSNIQVCLMNYKNRKFPELDSIENLKI